MVCGRPPSRAGAAPHPCLQISIIGCPPAIGVADRAGSAGSGLTATGSGDKDVVGLSDGAVGVEFDLALSAQAPNVAANPRPPLNCSSRRRLRASTPAPDP